MLVRDQHYKNAGWGPTIRSRKLLRVKAEPQTLTLKAERKGRESELIHGRCAHLRSPLPGERPWLLQMPIVICADGGDGCFRRMKLIVNIELIYGRCAHLRSPFPGIGESAGEEAAQSFDPLTSRGFVRVARGRYPAGAVRASSSIRGCRPDRRACRARGYTLDSCKDYQVERYQHDCSGFTDEASHRNRW